MATRAAVLLLSFPVLGHVDFEPVECQAPQPNDARSIAVEYPSEGPVPCVTIYRKKDVGVEPIARAQHEQGFCERVATKVRDNLEDAGFVCRATPHQHDDPLDEPAPQTDLPASTID